MTSALRDRAARPRTVGAPAQLAAGASAVERTFERRRRAVFARHGFPAEAHLVSDRHGRDTYLLAGGEGGPPVLLIHGGLSQAGEWAPVAGRLGGRVLVPDRPGCGLSHPIDYRGTDYRRAAAEWVRDLLDGIGLDEVDHVGNSIGGFFAMAFAAAHPSRVRRLALVGAPAGLDRPLPLFLRLWGHPLLGPALVRAGATTPADPEAFRERVCARLLVAHAEDLPRDFLELAVAAQDLPGAERGAYTMLRRVLTLRGWRRHLMMRDALAALDVPTLFVWGEKDRFAPPASGEDMVRRMPAADMRVLEDTGHLPHVERPTDVAAAVDRFLEAGETATKEDT